MRRFVKLAGGLAVGAFFASGLWAQTQCAVSVLSNINCGGNQATCFQQRQALSGGVRCTCTATCLSPQSITTSVGATRAVVWGTYAGTSDCASVLTGTAKGGTMATSFNPSTTSAVFAYTEISGAAIGRTSSQQTVDCFRGTIIDEDVIRALC